MIRGIYTAASGMMVEVERTDVIANNLANAGTAGFKGDVAVTKDFAAVLLKRINDGPEAPYIGSTGAGALVDEVATRQTQGSIRYTGNDLDLAIEGSGFFVVATPQGQRYTRNGSFTVNSQGQLVTADGYRVLGQGGPIQLNEGKVAITGEGQITVDGLPVGQLLLVDFADSRRLVKEGSSLYAAPEDMATQPSAGRVIQGALEGANVNVVSEMVQLIAAYRAYEINAKTVQTHDQLLDKAVNEVGRV